MSKRWNPAACQSHGSAVDLFPVQRLPSYTATPPLSGKGNGGERGVTERLDPIGFWSYTRDDDSASAGRLSRLRVLLTNELQVRLGRLPPVRIFQDVAAIPYGTDWDHAIGKALGQSLFFIPIVTPGFVQSQMCCMELLRFREFEAARRRTDLIFPLHYIDTDDLDPDRSADCFDPAALRLIRARQMFDFRDMRFRDPNNELVLSRVADFAIAIRATLRREVPRAHEVPVPLTSGAVPLRPPTAGPAALLPESRGVSGSEAAPNEEHAPDLSEVLRQTVQPFPKDGLAAEKKHDGSESGDRGHTRNLSASSRTRQVLGWKFLVAWALATATLWFPSGLLFGSSGLDIVAHNRSPHENSGALLCMLVSIGIGVYVFTKFRRLHLVAQQIVTVLILLAALGGAIEFFWFGFH
jgi:hypothetical protein